MPDLRVDIDRMRSVGLDLARIGGEFESANVRSDSVADATGHDGLAEVVRSFAHSWDDTREAMVGGIKGLGEASTMIADAFTQTDSELARALTEPARSQWGSAPNPRLADARPRGME